MKFDVAIGNTPYQIQTEGTSDCMKHIYNQFIKDTVDMGCEYINFLIPSRWMNGGLNLEEFRYFMVRCNNIKELVDYQYAMSIFPEVWIDSGLCYFLYKKDYNGKCNYKYIKKNGETQISERYLSNEFTNGVIRDIRQLSIIEKVLNKGYIGFDTIVSSRKPYGLGTDFFNNPEKYTEVELIEKEDKKAIKIYGVHGFKGKSRRTFNYINREGITKAVEEIEKYKVFASVAYNMVSTVPPEYILGQPKEICTETFLRIGPFETEEEQKNCVKYMKTNFFRALLFFARAQKNTTAKTYRLIPLLEFNKVWTDEELYNMFNLDNSEIEYINSLIKTSKVREEYDYD